MKPIARVIMVLALFAGIFFHPVYAHGALQEAQFDYMYGSYDEALRKAKSLALNDEVMYFLGLVNIKLGDHHHARQYLHDLGRRYPHSAYRGRALAKLGDTYFFQRQYRQAEEFYREVEKRFPSSEELPHVYLRLAQIAAREGRWKEKNEYIIKVRRSYPRSPEIRFIRILEGYGDYFTIQVGAFAERDNALSLYNELIKKYSPRIVRDEDDSFVIHKVQVGRFDSRQDAESEAKRLMDDGYPAQVFP